MGFRRERFYQGIPLSLKCGAIEFASGALVPILRVRSLTLLAVQVGMDGHSVASLKLIDQVVARFQSPFPSHHSASMGTGMPSGGSALARTHEIQKPA